MAHQLVLFINLIGVLLFDAFLIGDISITQNIPSTMDPGTEVRVTVTVNKGDLNGFAKLQLDLPVGMTATAIETKGASFTFADQKAKFIWMALPSTPTFKVTYTLSAEPSASGNLPIIGRFSYIEDNERKTFDLPTTTVNLGTYSAAQITEEPASNSTEEVTDAAEEAEHGVVGDETSTMIGIGTSKSEPSPSVDPSPSNVPVPPTPTASKPVPAVTIPPVTKPAASTTQPTPAAKTQNQTVPETTPPVPNAAVVSNAAGTAPMQGKGEVSSKRKVTVITAEEMLVEVTIIKGAIRGFGKLQEVIPAGFSAVEKNSADAIFTTQDRILKFVWLNLPAKNEVTVVYKLRSNDPGVTGERSIDGEFGYLLDDETQKCTTGTTKFLVGPDALIANGPEITENIPTPDPVETSDVPVPTPEVDPITPSQPEETADTPEPATEKEMRPEVTQEPIVAERSTIPSPEKGITFKVQIIAGHKEVSRSYFRVLHNFSGSYSMERHQGWIKYVTGSFTAYKDARDQRNSYVQAGNNFPGPFVTAYNNGERITVQEALVLSNQKWAS